jgi:exodeoxyribonuclease VIII
VRIVKGIFCISDLKTTTDASPVGFGKQVFNRGYDVQAAWYYNAYVAAIGGDIDCRSFLVAQEKSGVKAVATYQVTEPVLQLGTSKINAIKAQYAECLQSDKWEAYPELTELTIPAWVGV